MNENNYTRREIQLYKSVYTLYSRVRCAIARGVMRHNNRDEFQYLVWFPRNLYIVDFVFERSSQRQLHLQNMAVSLVTAGILFFYRCNVSISIAVSVRRKNSRRVSRAEDLIILSIALII